MNKNTQIISEERNVNNKRKSKFNKFFSTVSAVMIASSIAIGPMTLRGEETEKKKEMTYEELIQKRKESTEELRKAGEENMKEGLEGIKKADEKIKKADEKIKKADEKIKKADEKIKKADEEIERSKKEIEDAKKKIEEADKKIEEAKMKCNKYLVWLNGFKEYCSKNECSIEEKSKLSQGEKKYEKECSELMALVK